eukprot:PhM_4_TR15968/c1_g1_i5/m.45659
MNGRICDGGADLTIDRKILAKSAMTANKLTSNYDRMENGLTSLILKRDVYAKDSAPMPEINNIDNNDPPQHIDDAELDNLLRDMEIIEDEEESDNEHMMIDDDSEDEEGVDANNDDKRVKLSHAARCCFCGENSDLALRPCEIPRCRNVSHHMCITEKYEDDDTSCRKHTY